MKTYPLSQSQLGVYLEHIQHPESMQYNLSFRFHFSKGTDPLKLKQAILSVMEAYPVFYTRVITQDGELRQYPDFGLQIDIPIIHISEEEVEQQIQQFIRPFDFQKDALSRSLLIETPASLYFLSDIHHFILDGSSVQLLIRYIGMAYDGQVLPKEQIPLYEYAEQEELSFRTPSYEQAATYYKEKFAGVEMTKLLQKSNNEGTVIKRSAFVSKESIDDFCARHKVKPSWLFMAALGITLSRFSRTETVAYTSINHGRHDKRLLDSFGMFVKIVPILMRIDETQPVVDFIKSHKQELTSTIQQGSYPFTHFCQHLGIKPELTFGFQGSGVKEECVFLDEYIKFDQLLASGLSAENPSVIIYETNTKYEIRLKYVDSQYEAGYMRQFVNSMVTCIEQLIIFPDKLLKDISIVSEAEQQKLIALGKGEELVYDQAETFIDLFQKQVVLYPDSIAVVDEVSSITYADLDRQSDLLAHALADSGVGSDEFVAVMLPRRKEFLISVLAVFKAGGAYIPLDSDYPNERLLYMLEDSGAKVLITTRELLDEKRKDGDFRVNNILFVDEFYFSGHCTPINNTHPESLAYMIYTSGSTGKPKGVMIPHCAILNLIHFIVKRFGLSVDSRIGCHSNFGFDVSIEDLYPTLSVGGTLHILSAELRDHLSELYDYICNHRLTGGGYTTQYGMLMASTYDLPSDYYISLGGEKLASNPATKNSIYNMYGPTEFTVDATYFELQSGKHYNNIPIGRPLYNLSAYIVDNLGQLIPCGGVGELCMAGSQIAIGYWNRPELTAEKFINCPFIEGEKMYRTGDLARWNEDGELEYLGRIDNQVKLRGFRIELGEIESAISKYVGIQSSVVEVKEIGSVQHLCGYYTSVEAIDEEKLHRYLSETLTDYMVPTAFVRLDSMPLTPNGKINRKVLPMPEIKANEMAAPITGLEQSLFDIASEILGTRAFGVTSNLISMGLTSMGAIRLSLALQRELGLNLSVKNILQYPNIRKWTSLFQSSQESIRVYEKREVYPLLLSQERFYDFNQQHSDAVHSNISSALKLTQVDAVRLYSALEKVLEIHPYLKVRFGIRDGEVVWLRRDDAPIHILVEKLNLEPDSEFFQSRIHPFNLLKDELYRMEIYTSPKHTYLFMDIHHIVFDGGSLNILLNDLQKAYDGCELLPESFTTYAYSLNCEEWKKTEEYVQTESYFRKLTSGTIPALYPPSSSSVADKKAKYLTVSIPRTAAKKACQDLSVTENCFFVTAFMQVLHRSTGEEHILLETVSNGRLSEHLANTVGLLLQSLPIVSHQQSQTIVDAMLTMQKQLLTTFGHKMYSLPDLSDWYPGMHTKIGFNYQGELFDGEFSLGEAPVEWLDTHLDMAKLPIDLYVEPLGDVYQLMFEYDSGLYTEEDMLRLGNELRTFIQSVATADPLCDITRI